MKWRIEETNRGYYAQYGTERTSETAPFILNNFWITISARFDTKKEAISYIRSMKKRYPNE